MTIGSCHALGAMRVTRREAIDDGLFFRTKLDQHGHIGSWRSTSSATAWALVLGRWMPGHEPQRALAGLRRIGGQRGDPAAFMACEDADAGNPRKDQYRRKGQAHARQEIGDQEGPGRDRKLGRKLLNTSNDR